MNKKDLWFLLIAVGVIGLFTFLWAVSRKAPPLDQPNQPRPEHAGMTRDTKREECWACHAPDSTVAPMSARHPKKGKPPDQTTPCYVCHKYPDPAAKPAIFITPLSREVTSTWLSQPAR